MCVCVVEDGKVRRCSLHEAAGDYLEQLLAMEKANARLQERLKVANKAVDLLTEDRDGAEALAKVRGEALDVVEDDWHYLELTSATRGEVEDAIAMTPEEAGEKEGAE